MAKGIKFSETEERSRAVLKDIGEGKFAPVYLLHGDDPYFIDLIDRTIASKALGEEMQAFNQIIMYGLDTDCGTVQSYCRQMPMMGGRMVIILREAQNLKKVEDKVEDLEPYVSNPSPSTILVICFKGSDKKHIDQRSRFYKACVSNGVVIETSSPREYEIGGFIRSFVSSRGFEIDPRSVEVLVSHMGTDLSRISRELDKLMVALPVGTKRITSDDIEKYIGISKRFNIFELLNAVLYGKMDEALTIADHLMSNPKENPALLVIKMMYAPFRNMFIVNYLTWRARVKHVPFPSPAEMLQLLHTNDQGKRAITECAQKWDNRKVFRVLGLLREYDAKSKGLDRGDRTDAELVRELILKIFLQ